VILRQQLRIQELKGVVSHADKVLTSFIEKYNSQKGKKGSDREDDSESDSIPGKSRLSFSYKSHTIFDRDAQQGSKSHELPHPSLN